MSDTQHRIPTDRTKILRNEEFSFGDSFPRDARNDFLAIHKIRFKCEKDSITQNRKLEKTYKITKCLALFSKLTPPNFLSSMVQPWKPFLWFLVMATIQNGCQHGGWLKMATKTHTPTQKTGISRFFRVFPMFCSIWFCVGWISFVATLC